WWHRALVGYLVSLPLIGLALLLTDLGLRFGIKPYISGGSFSLVTIVIALLWGVGPAVLAIMLGFVTHSFFVLPLYGSYLFESWGVVAMYAPWLLGQLIVLLIAAQREKAQRLALAGKLEICM